MRQQITQNLKSVREKIKKTNQKVRLVAVTKTRSPKEISLVIAAGINSIGENKVQ